MSCLYLFFRIDLTKSRYTIGPQVDHPSRTALYKIVITSALIWFKDKLDWVVPSCSTNKLTNSSIISPILNTLCWITKNLVFAKICIYCKICMLNPQFNENTFTKKVILSIHEIVMTPLLFHRTLSCHIMKKGYGLLSSSLLYINNTIR